MEELRERERKKRERERERKTEREIEKERERESPNLFIHCHILMIQDPPIFCEIEQVYFFEKYNICFSTFIL